MLFIEDFKPIASIFNNLIFYEAFDTPPVSYETGGNEVVLSKTLRSMLSQLPMHPLVSSIATLNNDDSITHAFSALQQEQSDITMKNINITMMKGIEHRRTELFKGLESITTILDLLTNRPSYGDGPSISLNARDAVNEIEKRLLGIHRNICPHWDIYLPFTGLGITPIKKQPITVSSDTRSLVLQLLGKVKNVKTTIDNLLDDTQHLNPAADSSRDTIPTPSSDNSVGDTESSNRTSTPSVDENETPQRNKSFTPAAGAESGVEPPASTSQSNDSLVPLQQDGPPVDLLRRDNPTDTPDIEQEDTGEPAADILKNPNATGTTEATVDNLAKPQSKPSNPTDPVATPNTPAPKSTDATTIFRPVVATIGLASLGAIAIVAYRRYYSTHLGPPPKPSLSVYRLLKWELAFLTTFTIAFVGRWAYKRYMNGDDEPMGRKPSEKTSASTRAKYMPQGHNNPLSPGVTKENQQEDNNTKSESHASKATVSSACSHHHGGLFTGSLFAIVPLLLMAVA